MTNRVDLRILYIKGIGLNYIPTTSFKHQNPIVNTGEVIVMFPWKRKRDWSDFFGDDFFGDDFFKDLDEEFMEMEKNIAQIFDEIRTESLKEPKEGGPYVYGFSMRIDPEGKPRIEEFGNIPDVVSGEVQIPSEREPLTDIIEGDKEISVIAELPGITREDIDLNISDNSLEINVDTAERKYHKKLELPCKIKPENARATYKNGVLEVKIERLEKKKKREGVHLRVE